MIGVDETLAFCHYLNISKKEVQSLKIPMNDE